MQVHRNSPHSVTPTEFIHWFPLAYSTGMVLLFIVLVVYAARDGGDSD